MMKRFNFIASTLAKSALAVSFLFCTGILNAQNHTAADSTAAHAVATTAAAEYAYDANGNMTRDANRGICKIEYNCLNLPNLIVFANGDSIQNTYAADGTKLQTVRKTGGKTTTTDYCGNAVYVDGELKMLLNDYGYVSMPDRKFHFYIRDAQGNVRVVADAEGNVEEVNDYYPSGTLMSGTAPNNTQPYKYNGKELDRSAGLDLYDYGARLYDPTIGRFTTPDPLAEKYYPYSPYGYCLGNPVRYIDPNGKFPQIPPFFGWSNPLISASSRIGMFGTTDKMVRVLPKEEHHIIPRSLKGNPLVESARKGGFKLEGKENKMTIDKYSKATGEGQHGKHPNYTKQVDKKLGNSEKLSPKQASERVRDVIKQIKETIQNNPDTKINDLQLGQDAIPIDNLTIEKPELPEKLEYIAPNRA